MKTKNTELMETALANLKTETGIDAQWTDGPEHPDTRLAADGRILFRYNDTLLDFTAEVKKELQPPHLAKLIEQQRTTDRFIVVAQYIYPTLKKELRAEGIAYLETNGNIFLKEDNLWLWLEPTKTEKPTTDATGRAFAKTGLRLIFHFLLDETLINETYRTIAIKTGVGFGNINFILKDLREQGFLLALTKDTYVLTRKKELLDKWMQGYKERLKPTLAIGRFRFVDPVMHRTWEQLPLEPGQTWWGGEPAGNLLTNYLQPELFTLYTTEKRMDIIKKYRLLPDPGGNIYLYEKFWHFTEKTPTAPALLVYTDLMNTNDRRCIETAEKIYHAYLQDKF